MDSARPSSCEITSLALNILTNHKCYLDLREPQDPSSQHPDLPHGWYLAIYRCWYVDLYAHIRSQADLSGFAMMAYGTNQGTKLVGYCKCRSALLISLL